MKMLLGFTLVVITVAAAYAYDTPSLQAHEEKYDNGKPKLSYRFYVNSKGEEVKHGSFTAWYESGMKSVSVEFKHGQPTGVLTRWYESGQKLAEVEEEGTRGHELLWYETGEKQSVTMYKGEDFEMHEWYPTGTNKTVVELVKGTGEERTWYANGQLRTTTSIENSKPHGDVKCWDCKGRLMAQGKNKHGARDTGSFVRWGSDYKKAVIDTLQDDGSMEQVHVVPLYDEQNDRSRILTNLVSNDPQYGYTKDKPVKLGGGQLGILTAEEAERRYLRHLRTPAMVPFDFSRTGSVGGIMCGAETHVIDAYKITSRDRTVTNTIYIDMYHDDIQPLDAPSPKGLLLLGSDEKWIPSMERELERGLRQFEENE